MSTNCKSRKVSGANEAFQALMDAYPKAKHVKAELWELLIAAMGSDHADMWNKKERAKKMFLVELLNALIVEGYQ